MKDHMTFDHAPVNEPCAQTVDPDYQEKAHRECTAYINQLWRLLERERGVTRDSKPESFTIRRKRSSHDSAVGPIDYLEIRIGYDTGDDDSLGLALWLEANMPEHWDAEARQELTQLSPVT